MCYRVAKADVLVGGCLEAPKKITRQGGLRKRVRAHSPEVSGKAPAAKAVTLAARALPPCGLDHQRSLGPQGKAKMRRSPLDAVHTIFRVRAGATIPEL